MVDSRIPDLISESASTEAVRVRRDRELERVVVDAEGVAGGVVTMSAVDPLLILKAVLFIG